MTTTEKNELIAKFLGYSQPHPDYPHTTYWYKKDEAPLTMLSFDTDWNWLMEVVEKIESIVWEETNDTSFNVTIGATSYCVIQDNNGGMIEIIGEGKSKLESVYNACVEFVKWYNEQK